LPPAEAATTVSLLPLLTALPTLAPVTS